MVSEVVNVRYQDQTIGAVSFDSEKGYGSFEYTPSFVRTGIELSPIEMPLSDRVYSFPALPYPTFKGLPGMLADSLPDDFGNAVMNAWVAAQGKSPKDITPLQRLQYTGRRGMGALEYTPPLNKDIFSSAHRLEIDSLVTIAQEVLDSRGNFEVELKQHGQEDREAMFELMSVGMSAGGARPKAVLAFNHDFTQVRSGQAEVPAGFEHYLMKFDGVSEHNTGKETFGDPSGFGVMEYVYYLMATAAGIEMEDCRLLPEGNRRHFITRRFDRNNNDKRHIQTLNGIAHVDYKSPGSFSYEELFHVARQLKLSRHEAEQLIRRMCFNIVARNHDDHAKNVAFMLDGKKWKLAPAYDVAYSYKPGSKWVNCHWMSLNGKRDDFTRRDFHQLGHFGKIFSPDQIDAILDETIEQVSQWRTLAEAQEVPAALIDEVEANLRLGI
ncbi:type II toxin-antitoxin system HipA family toxin [Alteromonas halophila]|uniref:Toxin HipA n=1 Tax=Alteromonas halophila TaxID=516698 RepID=A0A918JN69_9ALTE|nr:type II toxin-antitoxin system HipA family toxin [Alteromonas halophila]GGW87380.1 toxin HipA [Alteromonas halophila]